MTSLAPAAAWFRRRAENVAAALLAVMFARLHGPDHLSLCPQFPDRLDQRNHVVTWVWIVLWGAAFVVRETREIRFDLIYGTVGPSARRVMALVTGVALVALYRVSLPAVVDYVTFMKVERDGLPQHPLRLAVLDLHRLRGRDRSSAISGSAGRRCGARRRRRSIRPRRGRAYEPRQPVLASPSSPSRRWRSSACRSATR